MKLKAGQRYRLTDEKKFALVNSGRVEVYATARDIANFRQVCLMELNVGAVYPSFDDLDIIDIVIYAVEDSEIDFVTFFESTVAFQIPLMRAWFSELAKLQWLKIMADRGDENIIQWRNCSLFESCKSLENLYRQFLEQERLFSTFTGAQFSGADIQFIERLKMRQQNSQLLIKNSINRLVGEYEVGKSTSGDKLNETVFIVREVAKYLSMSTENISIAPEFVKRLDQVGIIRRLGEYESALCYFGG